MSERALRGNLTLGWYVWSPVDTTPHGVDNEGMTDTDSTRLPDGTDLPEGVYYTETLSEGVYLVTDGIGEWVWGS